MYGNVGFHITNTNLEIVEMLVDGGTNMDVMEKSLVPTMVGNMNI